MRLHGKMRIKKQDSNGLITNLVNDNVSTVNNIFNSLWASINTKLNGTEISDPTSSWYAYKSYLENHLSYSSSVKKKGLSFKGYVEDTHNELDNLSSDSKNEGFLSNFTCFQTSRPPDFETFHRPCYTF